MLLSTAAIAQNITLKAKKLPLEDVFAAIQQQTGYRVSGKIELIRSGRPLTANVRNLPLEDFLKLVVKDQSFNYAIVEKNIIISAKVSAPSKQNAVQVQLRSAPLGAALFSGRIKDSRGNPVSGVTVTLKDNTKMISVSNLAGEFSIDAPKGTAVQLSHVAFVTKDIVVSAELLSNPEIQLTESSKDLKEVSVNRGYYSTTKSLNTGSVSSISAVDIEKQPVSNLLQALQSRIPGLIIVQQSGNPGSNFTIQLRGRNSLNKSNPLFIVDGIPFNASAMGQVAGRVNSFLGGLNTTLDASAAGSGGLSPLNSINPEDIESIDVLKDADATAIYGSLGANGVILITTKRGKTGPMVVNAKFNIGLSSPGTMPKFLNTQQYLGYRRALLKNDGRKPGATDYDLNGTWDTTRYTPWGKDLIGNYTVNSNASVSLSGGSVQTRYYFNVGHTETKPPYDGDFSDKRTTLSFNISTSSLNDRFKMVFSGNYGHDANTLPGLDISSFLGLAPNAPDLLNSDGSLNWWHATAENPYASLKQKYSALTKNAQINALISYQLLPGLSLKGNIGYSDVNFDEQRLNPLSANNPAIPGLSASSLTGNSSSNTWIAEPQAEFSHGFLGGKITVLLGGTFQDMTSQGLVINAFGFANDAMLGDVSAASKFSVRNRYSKYRYNALFGRINYNLHERYVINLTGRRDGSSRFAPGRQFGNFGAVGAAWIFGKEEWIEENIPILSFGKLRGSFGITGNDQIGDYRYLDSYTANNAAVYLGTGSIYPTRLFNDLYRWESNRKLEASLELGFFSDRLMLTSSLYRNRSSNQLVNLPLAPTTGYNIVQGNLPALIQNTGLELELSGMNIKNDHFVWRTSFNISFERNRLLEFPDLASSPYRNQYVVGRPISISEPLFHMIGVNPQTGLYEFLGSDGKPTSSPVAPLDATERIDLVTDFYGGLGNSFRYKNFELDIQLQFVKQTGRNVLFSTLGVLPFSGITNLPEYFYGNIWLKEGDIATLQRLSGGGLYPGGAATANAQSAAGRSDAAFSDASYIRCKNVSLSWQFGEQWLRKIRLKQLRVYAQAQNLFTITGYKGFDPESQGSLLPPLRTIVFGLQLTL